MQRMEDHGDGVQDLRADRLSQAEVAAAARMLARMGYVHAFGHVSQRESERILITPTRPPLAVLDARDVLAVTPDGELESGEAAAMPLETPMHLAIYRARPDVNSICRVHSPAVAVFASRRDAPGVFHGFGGMAEPLALWPDPDLVATGTRAQEVALAFGQHAVALLLRGNGGLAVGTDLATALARTWCLEDRCRVALEAGTAASALSGQEYEHRRRWYGAELERIWAWLRVAFGADWPA